MEPFRSSDSSSRELEREYEGAGAWQEYDRGRAAGGFGTSAVEGDEDGESAGGGDGWAV